MRPESFARWQIPRDIDGVVMIGDMDQGPGRSGFENRHNHAELEMHLVTQGRCVFLARGSRIDAERGTLVWIPPRCEHTVLDPSRDFKRWMMLWRPRLVHRVLPAEEARLLLGAGANGGERPPASRTLSPAQTHVLEQKFEDARRTGREAASLHNATMGYLLGRAFSAFASADGLPVSSALHPAVASAVRVLRTPDTELSRGELARRCGMSEWHLSKLFREQIGVSLVDFRNRCRLERFLELYGDGSRVKMTAAALDAGFGSYPQFHRIFRSRMGHSPAEHARRVRAR